MAERSANSQALFDVGGRTAVITGGSGQLGQAMAAALAEAGARVAILGRHIEAANTVAEAIRAGGGAAIGVACDVLDRASLERSREQVTSAFGPADILVNAAGGNSAGGHNLRRAVRSSIWTRRRSTRSLRRISPAIFRHARSLGATWRIVGRAASSMSPR